MCQIGKLKIYSVGRPDRQPQNIEVIMGILAKRVDAHVGGRIRDRRTGLGLTQEHLANALNISYQQVQKYETGAKLQRFCSPTSASFLRDWTKRPRPSRWAMVAKIVRPSNWCEILAPSKIRRSGPPCLAWSKASPSRGTQKFHFEIIDPKGPVKFKIVPA